MAICTINTTGDFHRKLKQFCSSNISIWKYCLQK